MLVLTRKYQEKIRIGNNITITVLRTKGKAVRLGIEAPADIPVIRGELSFENDSAKGEEPATADSFEKSEPVKHASRSAGMAAATRWETARDSETKVTLSRVPRNQVADMLPKMVSGSAPLRAIMEQNSSR